MISILLIAFPCTASPEVDYHSHAMYVLSELERISDTGIYATLALDKIVNASHRVGVYHHNYEMTLVLRSPFFANGSPTSSHNVMVMVSLSDNKSRSFAIDEFPEMDDDAMEDFWIRKVEAHRAAREAVLREWEMQHDAGVGIQHDDESRKDL